MAHPQHNFTSNFNGSDGHNAELTLNINGVEKKYTPAGNDQTYNVPGVARIDINLDGADLVQAIQTALDGAAQPVLVERSIYDEEVAYPYIGDLDGAWYFGICTTNKIVTIAVDNEDGALNVEQIPVANGVVIVPSDGLNVYSQLRTAIALGQLPVLSYVGANPVYAQYEKTADNGDLIFVGALATASDTYVQYNIYTVSDNNTVTVTTRAASAGGGGTPDDENGFFNTSSYITPGDGVTESITIDDFRIKNGTSIHGSNIEFIPTHQEGGIDYGEVWLNPGTYILNIRYTLQWVGNPRGTFLPLVCRVGGQPFDFSFEQENTLITSQIRVVTTRQKVSIALPFDADTPPMGIWVSALAIAQLASNTHPAVVHDTTLAGSGTAGSPLGVTTDVFSKIKDIPISISQFRTGDVMAVAGPNGPAKIPASDLRDAILGGPIDEAVQTWLDEHPEATTTVEDHSLTYQKLVNGTLNFVTPEMFGAVGDGVTDDSLAFSAATEKGLPILGDRTKTYALSQSFSINSSLYDCKFKYLGNGVSIIIEANGSVFENVEIDCGSFITVQAADVRNSSNIVFKNLSVKNMGNTSGEYLFGLRLRYGCHNVTIRDSSFVDIMCAQDGESAGIYVSNNDLELDPSTDIFISNCYFENIGYFTDADAVKILGAISRPTNVNLRVSHCIFKNILKRAMKFQAYDCHSDNNIMIVNKPTRCFIDFQEGHGSSDNDTVILDYDGVTPIVHSGLLTHAIEIELGEVSVRGLKVRCINEEGVDSNLAAFYLGYLWSITTAENISITDCDIQGFNTLFQVEPSITVVKNVKLHANITPYGATSPDACFIMRSAAYSQLDFDCRVDKEYTTFYSGSSSHTITQSKIKIVGPSNAAVFWGADSSCELFFRTTRSPSICFFRGYDYVNGKHRYYLKDANLPSNLTATATSMARASRVGDVIEPTNISVSGNKVKREFICYQAGTSSSMGLFMPIEYELPANP